MDCGGHIVCILGTKKGFSHANIEVYALKSVLKIMCSDKVSAWFSVL